MKKSEYKRLNYDEIMDILYHKKGKISILGKNNYLGADFLIDGNGIYSYNKEFGFIERTDIDDEKLVNHIKSLLNENYEIIESSDVLLFSEINKLHNGNKNEDIKESQFNENDFDNKKMISWHKSKDLDNIEDMTADEIAYERYKRGECTYQEYTQVCDGEDCDPEPELSYTNYPSLISNYVICKGTTPLMGFYPNGLPTQSGGIKEIISFSKDCYDLYPTKAEALERIAHMKEAVEKERERYEDSCVGSTDKLLKLIDNLVIKGELTKSLETEKVLNEVDDVLREPAPISVARDIYEKYLDNTRAIFEDHDGSKHYVVENYPKDYTILFGVEMDDFGRPYPSQSSLHMPDNYDYQMTLNEVKRFRPMAKLKKEFYITNDKNETKSL